MNTILSFSNPSEIDPLLISTMGVNVKESANPIGYFGTGLKYAIAVAVRGGHSFVIQSGEREFHFAIAQRSIRGKSFDFITMTEIGGAEQTLGFTTELGRNWQPWMAYRELLCNAIDEGGTAPCVLTNWPVAQAGLTRVLTNDPTLIAIHTDVKPWLLDRSRALLWKTPELECYAGGSTFGFYHGIKVVEFPKPTHFTYNLTGQHELTEDRTFAQHTFTWYVAKEIFSRHEIAIPPKVLRAILRRNPEGMEGHFNWPSYVRPSDAILAEVATGGTHDELRNAVRSYLPKSPLRRTRYTDLKEQAPPLPPFTCPDINSIQSALANIIASLYTAKDDFGDDVTQLHELCEDAAIRLEQLLQQGPDGRRDTSSLEQLRGHNAGLRDWGIYWKEEAKAAVNGLLSRTPDAEADEDFVPAPEEKADA